MYDSEAEGFLTGLANRDLSHWGFTLYRTDYDPEHEAQWAKLLEAINQSTFKDIRNELFTTGALPADASPERKLQQRVWETFKQGDL